MKNLALFVVKAIYLRSHISGDGRRNLSNVSVLSCCNLGLSIYRTMANGGSVVCLFLGIVLVIVLGIVLGIVLAICWC